MAKKKKKVTTRAATPAEPVDDVQAVYQAHLNELVTATLAKFGGSVDEAGQFTAYAAEVSAVALERIAAGEPVGIVLQTAEANLRNGVALYAVRVDARARAALRDIALTALRFAGLSLSGFAQTGAAMLTAAAENVAKEIGGGEDD